MKLKSLLMGSAAAMLAGTSSFAADAVVAEPEAVEYVRVCDAYGAGYFFIPGTERCLQISGEVRFEYRINNSDANTRDDVDAEWAYRARLAVRSANESDFGTIRTYIRLEANYGDPFRTSTGFSTQPVVIGAPFAAGVNAGRDVGLQAMTLSIGGLEVGIFDNYWTKNGGYGNLRAMNDGYYGYDQALYAQYTYEVAGFAITAGVEQTLDNAINVGGAIQDLEGDDLNLYAGASYGGSWGNVAATLYYDNTFREFDYALKATLNPIEGLSVKGFYTGGDGVYARQARGEAFLGAGRVVNRATVGDYTYGLSAAYTFGDFTPYVGYTDSDAVTAPGTAIAGVVWSPSSADGLTVQGEVNYVTEDNGTNRNPQAYRLRLIKSF